LKLHNLLSVLDVTDEFMNQIITSDIYKLCQRYIEFESNTPLDLLSEENRELATEQIDSSQQLNEDSFFYNYIYGIDST